jgi:hypothetical protein
MRHAPTDHTPKSNAAPADASDAWLDEFSSAEADDTLDRQLFAIREALADFRSL